MMIYALFAAVKDHIMDYFRMRRIINEAATSKSDTDLTTRKENSQTDGKGQETTTKTPQ